MDPKTKHITDICIDCYEAGIKEGKATSQQISCRIKAIFLEDGTMIEYPLSSEL